MRGVSRLTNSPQPPGRCWWCWSTSKLTRVPRAGTLCHLCLAHALGNGMSSAQIIAHVNMLDSWEK
jgi:hypothetical protein